VDVPSPDALLTRLRSLDSGAVLLERLPAEAPVYLVGGAVRDLLRGERPAELDLVVEGDAVALARGLHGADVVAYDRFGTCTVRLDGHSYDIASARREAYERPGALPSVSAASLQVDLHRRDFSVNAIAMALGTGRLDALPGALDDLEARLLRVLHEASFRDDPTRLFRLIRYASRLDFAIEPHTRELALDAVHGGALKTVSGSRIGNELRLLAREPDPSRALGALRELELDRALHPLLGLADPRPTRKALELLPSDGRRDLMALAATAEAVPAPELHELLERLAFEASDRDRIIAAARARELAPALAAAQRASEIAAAARGAPPELVALAGGHGAAESASRWLDDLRHVRLVIDGRDLISAGVPEGPSIGKALDAALDAKLDGLIAGREQELAEALSAVR
jgi:tRNA nucleotidyltransferase (CCA-adding enzyme)